jgi:hypothetical protein
VINIDAAAIKITLQRVSCTVTREISTGTIVSSKGEKKKYWEGKNSY